MCGDKCELRTKFNSDQDGTLLQYLITSVLFPLSTCIY